MNETDRALRPLELRAEGRRLEGIVLRYGDVSPSHRERFLPGAFDLSGDRIRWLDYRHDQTRIVAHTGDGTLSLKDGGDALRLRADLPRLPLADKVLQEVNSGVLGGLSIEFRSQKESLDDSGIRVIEAADLPGIGLVPSPSYPDSRVETRQAGVIRGTIPYDSELACECYGRGTQGEQGGGITTAVQFAPGALEIPPG